MVASELCGGRLLASSAACVAALLVAACDSGAEFKAAATGAPQKPGDCPPTAGVDPPEATDDLLPPGRLLRRASLALRGEPPSDAEYAALEAAGDEPAQFTHVHAFVDSVLSDPRFYRTVFETALGWLNIPPVPRTADEPEYGVQQQRALRACAGGTLKAGALAYADYDASACDGVSSQGGPLHETTIEAWWEPGTTVALVGDAASTEATGSTIYNGNWLTIDCTERGAEGTCGCGPHGVHCYDSGSASPGWKDYLHTHEHGQRRQIAQEPARLFAHIVWYDRPLTDFVLGTYSVGSTNLQAAYVSQGLAGGAYELLGDTSWWQPADYADALTDPYHGPGDATAWREYEVPERNPFFLADRDYTYDPRTATQPMLGIGAAGMLTSLGFLNAYPRERIRAARALEALACEVLSPPSADQTFNEYHSDPYDQGACQHCHRRIDPAAIHFKRYGKRGSAKNGWGATFIMPGIGDIWQFPAAWHTGSWPYHTDPFAHWNRWYSPGTGLTPVTAADEQADPFTLFIDVLPPEMTLLGQTSDGTAGPLGFAKLIVQAGAFDKCMVRRIHTMVLGRDIEPALEAGYLEKLTADFVAGGRLVRPLVKQLTLSDLFARGI